MQLVIKTGIATGGPAFEEGDVVDWPDAEAKRLIAKGYAEEATPEEIKTAGKKAKRYLPPPPPVAEKPGKPHPAARERGALAREQE